MALVIVVTPMLFPSSRRATPAPMPTAPPRQPTTAAPNTAAVAAASRPQPTQRPTISRGASFRRPMSSRNRRCSRLRARSTRLSAPALSRRTVQINGYLDLRPGRKDSMFVMQRGGPLLHYRLATGADTDRPRHSSLRDSESRIRRYAHGDGSGNEHLLSADGGRFSHRRSAAALPTRQPARRC